MSPTVASRHLFAPSQTDAKVCRYCGRRADAHVPAQLGVKP